ncbi:aldehyde dehydrogenase [Segetibacter koreensis]|uniref:aldehyde dehydrogenase n=1 Tax=Segetibacter koreensis TaxID=398037 RepID=UPI00036E73E4|nr:aldehyde dehydrogenase [Segetibacter koreensis]
MSTEKLEDTLKLLKNYYNSGVTLPYSFRKENLQKLKGAIQNHEEALYPALYADLKKSREESWVTEIGFLLSEISHALKHLRGWMKPEKVGTNLLNLPSKSFVYKEPLGVVLIIAPWNYPLQLLFAPLIGAIAAGNCAVLKASEFAPASSGVMKKIIEEIFPKEYILFTEGDGAEVVPQMMNNFRFDHVFYTGSTHVGKAIYEMAAKQLVPVTLELGGKSPCVVESDANIKVAARRIAIAKFSNVGQMCVAPDYVLVHRSIKNDFVQSLQTSIRSFFSDDPSRSDDYGKIVNDRAFNRLTAYLQQGTILFGGKFNAAAYYIEPTLIEIVNVNSTVMGEEIFGPVLPILTFETYEEAKAMIARNENPLAFYVFTSSRKKEEKWLSEVRFGGGCVNNTAWHFTNLNLPFGGRGNSGIGAYHGKYSFDVFSHQKAVMKTPTWIDPDIKYPPFKGKLKLFKKVIGY